MREADVKWESQMLPLRGSCREAAEGVSAQKVGLGGLHQHLSGNPLRPHRIALRSGDFYIAPPQCGGV